MPQANAVSKFRTIDLVYIAIGAVLMTVCSWISFPIGPVSITLQTFAVFAVIGLIGGFRGTMSIIVWIALGAVGAPVFSNFNGGIAALLGPTGGYIIGFIFSGMFFWLVLTLFDRGPTSRKIACICGMVGGIIICYTFGTAWFYTVYVNMGKEATLQAVLGWCVYPFIIPDIAKIMLAYALTITIAPKLKVVKY